MEFHLGGGGQITSAEPNSQLSGCFNALSCYPGADLAFFQGGGGVWPIVHEPRSGEPIFFFGYFTSREAASRFFWRFYEPRSGEPIFFWLFYEPRSGEPIFFGYFTSREAASRFFWAILNPRKWCFPGIY